MPAATTKSELLETTDKEFAKLSALLDGLDPAFACLPDDDGWSIKDVVAHRAHWIQLFLGWYRDGKAGKSVAFPAPGYNWNQLKDYNQALKDAQAPMTWEDARIELLAAYDALGALIVSLEETALYDGPMQGGQNAWTTGRWAEAAGASHYRSAAKFIRARLRELERLCA
ncbi:ClbS/DfsB family four-helix bundle protein [Shimia sp. SDUM112013]|uniref:ClbS/DfsB family four-helix bundle protein n=1 Tax=Shimia sp. SDUM112013 TaxID=3136160 RepID=UPI0032EBB27E